VALTQRVFEMLVCPLCGRELLEIVGDDSLRCESCDADWPVRDGVPLLVPSDIGALQKDTAEAFGWQWRHFDEMHEEFEAQFLDWIHPITPADFRGKRVLDAGCGTGRHAYFAAKYGAADVVALDLSDAVETARRNLAAFDNVHVIQGDLLRPPLRSAAEGGGFDIVYSIGVLHHLPDPAAGLRALVPLVRPGGTIAVWVYGFEGNGLVRHVVEPMRRLSTRLPVSVLRGLAWPLSLPFHALARGIYAPLSHTKVCRFLPLNEYMASVADFTFRQNYGIVFDQLAAPSTRYIRGDELKEWLASSGLEDVQMSHRHGNSWRGRARAAVNHG
jgi:SAM-dependent methyltransferase